MRYKTMNGWTKAGMMQAIRDKMLDHPSKAPDGQTCAYRAADGNRCAVGVFLPDGHPAESSIVNIDQVYTDYIDLRTVLPLALGGLCAMQIVHDYTGDMDTPRPDDSDPRPDVLRWIEENVED